MTPVFFTDRDLGKLVPKLLRGAGVNVEEHLDHFPDDAKDKDWLTEVGPKGWFCLTRDKHIRYRPNEIDAVMHADIGLFILIGKATHRQLAENFVNTLDKVHRFIQKHPRPFIAKVRRPTKKLRSSSRNRPGDVKLWLTQEEWAKRRGGKKALSRLAGKGY